MKKGISTFLSLLFLFSLVIVTVVLLGVFLNIHILWILLILWVLGVLWAIVVAFGKRRSDVKLRWVMFLIFVPIIGLFSYIFFGRKYHLSVDKNYQYLEFNNFTPAEQEINSAMSELILDNEIPQFKNAFNIGRKIQNDRAYRGSKATLLNNASIAWIQIFKDIDSAKDYVLINYYIIEDGELYRNLKRLLAKKIQQGVKVYMIFDFVGSFAKLSLREQDELRKLGVNLQVYMPMLMPFLNWKSNYRDHRKDISIDGRIGYFGGSNIADEYINKSRKFGFWNDEQVRVAGASVQGIEKIFASDWEFITKKPLTELEPKVGKIHAWDESDDKLTQIVACGPNHEISAHEHILLELIGSAKERIWISTPYFVPPGEVLEALLTAALSGIDVRIVLPGKTDKLLLLDVSERYADKLFKAGVKIYSMVGTFNHTKAYLVDNEISFIGSTNLDYRALFADQQTMGLIYSAAFNQKLAERFEHEMDLSVLHHEPLAKGKSWFRRFCTIMVTWASPLL